MDNEREAPNQPIDVGDGIDDFGFISLNKHLWNNRPNCVYEDELPEHTSPFPDIDHPFDHPRFGPEEGSEDTPSPPTASSNENFIAAGGLGLFAALLVALKVMFR